jgi:hypothetical protein
MKKTCKSCGKTCEGEYCFRHKPRKPLPKARALNKGVSLRKSFDGMQEVFLSIWKNRRHHSEVSGAYLGKEPLTVFFHHILPKEKYPQAFEDEENIILLTPEEHDQVEMDIYRYEEVNQRRNYLKIKYNL